MDLDEILLHCEESMEKSVEHLKSEMRGLRTGRASTALVEYVKVDYYGSMTELRQLALINVPEATQIVVKPFDQSSTQAIIKALQDAGLGLNPMGEGKQIRINIPPLSAENRQRLVAAAKSHGEEAKVRVRNARREANKHIDQAEKDKDSHISEDEAKRTKDEVQDLLKKYEAEIEKIVDAKVHEVQAV